jgi:hypothetical protein
MGAPFYRVGLSAGAAFRQGRSNVGENLLLTRPGHQNSFAVLAFLVVDDVGSEARELREECRQLRLVDVFSADAEVVVADGMSVDLLLVDRQRNQVGRNAQVHRLRNQGVATGGDNALAFGQHIEEARVTVATQGDVAGQPSQQMLRQLFDEDMEVILGGCGQHSEYLFVALDKVSLRRDVDQY